MGDQAVDVQAVGVRADGVRADGNLMLRMWLGLGLALAFFAVAASVADQSATATIVSGSDDVNPPAVAPAPAGPVLENAVVVADPLAADPVEAQV